MPYAITNESADCSGWATVDPDGDVIGCHQTKAEAIAQGVAVSLATGEEFVGERNANGLPAVITDIDDTLFVDGVVNQPVVDYLDSFDDTLVFVVTGRFVGDRDQTVAELEAADIDFDELL